MLAWGLRPVLGASLLLVGWAMAGAAQAQSFDSVVVFGDSISDPGNAADLQNLEVRRDPQLPDVLKPSLQYPTGTNFSTNPDWVWTQYVEEFYGGTGEHQLFTEGGTNYALGGGCVSTTPNDTDGCMEQTSIQNQMRTYFTIHGQQIDPDSLYILWGGTNDLDLAGSRGSLSVLGKALDPSNDPITQATGINTFSVKLTELKDTSTKAASDYLTQIKFLQDKGAENIVILNMPPLGLTPGIRQISGILSNIQLKPDNLNNVSEFINTNATDNFNEDLSNGLKDLNHGIVAIDAHGLFEEIVDNPKQYGFEEIEKGVCEPTSSSEAYSELKLPFDDGCGPDNDPFNYPYAYKSDTDITTYLFADNVHPSGAAHQMLANVVTSTLSAPVQVSLAGEGALSVARVHRRAVAQQGSMKIPLAETNMQFWTAGALAQEDQDSLPTLGSSSADLNVVTLGVSRDWDAGVRLGAAVSFGNHHNTVQGATLDSTATLWSVDGQWQRGPLQLKGGLAFGDTGVDIERSILLGPTERMEQGSTTVSHFGGNLDLDYTLPNGGDRFRHGLSAGLDWIDQDTDGYREGGNRSTAMNFDEFSRSSLTVRLGYGIEAAHNLGKIPLRPYARIDYERELETDPVRVSAGVNSMPGASFSLDGMKPPTDAAVLGVGAVADVNEHMEARLDYTFRTGDQSYRSHQVELGLNLTL